MSEQKFTFDLTPFQVPQGNKVRLKDYDPGYTGGIKDKMEAREALLEDVNDLCEAQDRLWASKEHAVIILFQALDAAGKDGTIKHVMSGVNPQGVSVHSFGPPSEEERQHNFLMRPLRVLPGRGRIAIFNRSYYEEVLVVRVHPELLQKQWIPADVRDGKLKDLWEQRYQAINQFERMLANSNILVLKFFLNVSRKVQRKRFLERLENPEKHWKFSAADLRERTHWDDYVKAYEDMLSATSTKVAPWYVIPADRKWFTRAVVADVITRRIAGLKLAYPRPSADQKAALAEALNELQGEGKDS